MTSPYNARARPLSAQRRRPSVTAFLDAIPENRTLLNRGTIDRFSEVDLTIDDIEDISSSSYDVRYPPKNVFKRSLTPGRFYIIIIYLLSYSLFSSYTNIHLFL
jgi:hypothetical protein